MEASSWDTAEALRDKDFVPCKSYSSSHRPSPGKRDEEKSQINAFYETVVAARGRDVPEPPHRSCHRVELKKVMMRDLFGADHAIVHGVPAELD